VTGIAVIVASFNRPRMLREALVSVVSGGPEQVIVVDDGSTFAVDAYSREFRTDLVTAPPLTVEERLRVARQGELLNCALGLVTQEVVTYLCDDDLHHCDWYGYLRAYFDAHPDCHYVRGDWGVFADGDMLGDRLCAFPDARRATCGNFAHRIGLVREGGAAWPLHHQVNLDDAFLHNLQRVGANVRQCPTVGFAGWRREHAHMGALYAQASRFGPEARAEFERGFAE
jgi:glycosyltransferase involved in cell wall biosynthesis